MAALEIAKKVLSQLNGLNRERIIDSKIIIDLKNRTIIVEGNDYTYAPNGTTISQQRFYYEVDNIPEIPKVLGVESVEEVLNEDGIVVVPAIVGVPEIPAVPANLRFDNLAASPVGVGIAGMVQATINTLSE